MSDDLVKRLRRADTCIFPTERDRCHCGEAADRILKLEAALRRIKHMHEDGGIDDIVERDDRTYFIVMNALEGKDD